MHIRGLSGGLNIHLVGMGRTKGDVLSHGAAKEQIILQAQCQSGGADSPASRRAHQRRQS
jgi:hypothetical protein